MQCIVWIINIYKFTIKNFYRFNNTFYPSNCIIYLLISTSFNCFWSLIKCITISLSTSLIA